MRLPFLLLLGLLLAIPPAGAHGAPVPSAYALEIEGPGQPLPPFTPMKANLTVRMPCHHDFGNASTVRFSVAATPAFPPAWLSVTFEDDVLALSEGTCDEEDRLILRTGVSLLATMDAPGVRPFLVGFQADVEGNGSRTLRNQTAVQVAYVSLLDVQLVRTSVEAKPGEVAEFVLVVDNKGNAVTRIVFEHASNDTQSFVALPPPITLQSRQTALDTSTTVVVRATQPPRFGFNQNVESFTLRLVPAYSLNASMTGEPQTASFTLQTKGFHTPGPGLAFVLPLLALAALAARRSRRDP